MSLDLGYTEVETDLRDAVGALLADRAPAAAVLARVTVGDGYDVDLWRRLAVDVGCAGLVIPEDLGGAGAGFGEVAVVLEELGRAVAPVPFLGSAVLATTALLACRDAPGPADAATVDRLLRDLAEGTVTAALALPLSTAPPAGLAPAPRPAAVRADGGAVYGTVSSVADALPAGVLLVPTATGLYAVDAAGAGVTRTPVVSLDQTRPLADIAFNGAAGTLLAAGERADRAVAAALGAGAALLASEQLGVAQWCLDTTVDYVKGRYQFGRPVGSFQALKHRLAEVWVQITQARAVARYAAACLTAGDPDAPVAAALAQAYCGPVAVHAAEECVQMHGGIGFTWEHPAHLYLKRAKADAIAFGTADRHRATVAALVDLPAPAT